MGYHGLAAGLAVMWDTQLSPGDVRALKPHSRPRMAVGRHSSRNGRRLASPVGGVLSARTAAILDAYLASLGAELFYEAPIFRNRSGATLPQERLLRRFPGRADGRVRGRPNTSDARFPAIGAVEAITGGAEPEELAHAMGNTLSASNALFETYVPVQTATLAQ